VSQNGKDKYYVTGPPTDGRGVGIGLWGIQLWGTQTNSNSVTAGTYNFLGNFAAGGTLTASPSVFTYVGIGT